MNYLAHAYLSFHKPGILVGNMISDFVKGKAQFDYPERIQKGITLHRAIDEFTDFHPVTQVAKSYFRPAYRLYSGAFVDIMYDHFLALDANEFVTSRHLSDFSNKTYELLDKETASFPLRFARMYPYMKSQNWLYNYRTEEGMRNSFAGLVRRAAYMNDSSTAFNIFLTNYDALKVQYTLFFPELKSFVRSWLEEDERLSDTTSA
jgi:acyl carrier protein phosphodiesterase